MGPAVHSPYLIMCGIKREAINIIFLQGAALSFARSLGEKDKPKKKLEHIYSIMP